MIGNFVNLDTYWQFTNAAWDWIIQNKKKKKKKKKKRKSELNQVSSLLSQFLFVRQDK